MPAPAPAAVLQFYESHPINEEQIVAALKARGLDLAGVTEEHLKEHDQDHYGGTDAVDRLMAAAGIRAGQQVLDVCSGMGGPARYVAWRSGANVTGLDFTLSRHEGAKRLTRLVGLEHLVGFRHGNALEMPFDDASFDVVIGQEAWAHVPDKPRLVGEVARVARPGGTIAFTDILQRKPLPADVLARLREGMTFNEITTADEYCRLLIEHGCAVVEVRDLAEEWTAVLQERHAMYRSLKDSTVARFGQAHYRKYDEAYGFFVSLYAQGLLGGSLIVARRPS